MHKRTDLSEPSRLFSALTSRAPSSVLQLPMSDSDESSTAALLACTCGGFMELNKRGTTFICSPCPQGLLDRKTGAKSTIRANSGANLAKRLLFDLDDPEQAADYNEKAKRSIVRKRSESPGHVVTGSTKQKWPKSAGPSKRPATPEPAPKLASRKQRQKAVTQPSRKTRRKGKAGDQAPIHTRSLDTQHDNVGQSLPPDRVAQWRAAALASPTLARREEGRIALAEARMRCRHQVLIRVWHVRLSPPAPSSLFR